MKILIDEEVLQQAINMLGTDDVDLDEYVQTEAALKSALDAKEVVREIVECIPSEITQFWVDRCLKLEAENTLLKKRLATVAKEWDELVTDAKRYRWLRTQNPRQYQELWNYCLNSDVTFDEQVDECINEALAKVGADKTGEK